MKKKMAILLGLSLLLSFTCIARSAQKNQIRVMSFNVRVDLGGGWGNRCDKVCDIMNDHNPDIIGVQEALAHQISEMQAQLPNYANYAVGRNDGKSDGESCGIYYKKDRFTLMEKGTFWFSDTPDEVSHGWDTWPRICTWVHLKDNSTGQGLYVYNVHLAAFFSQGARQKSVRLLTKRIAERGTDDPFMVIGDYNMKLNNSAMKYLLNEDGQTLYPRMTDAWYSVHNDSGPRWDHISLSPGIKVLSIELDERKASDHEALVANLELPAPTNIAAETENIEIPKPVQN
ncbi:MAG: endonuclease/exonuclease/phosphatase family protein [Phycisphaerales bacterium]